MSDEEVLSYVKAAAAALELPLSPAAAQRVAAQLARTGALARELEGAALGVDDEPAQIYLPAPFPPEGAGR